MKQLLAGLRFMSVLVVGRYGSARRLSYNVASFPTLPTCIDGQRLGTFNS
jgi:hypothetical protein